MKILIVDDSKAMRIIVKRTLTSAGYGGYTIVEAANGKEALDQIKASKPDFVLSDWNMPEMSGIELLTALKADSITVPFGFVTSETTDEMRERAKSNGALFLLGKPFTPETMSEVLRPVLNPSP
jgi:two-component system chemotaxis response regulator CheY